MNLDQILDNLRNNVDDRHILWIGAVFLLLQLYLCVRFFFSLGRWRKAVRQLSNQRRNLARQASRFGWLAWVEANFPPDAQTLGAYTREDVFQELDARLGGNSHYLLLQRTGRDGAFVGRADYGVGLCHVGRISRGSGAKPGNDSQSRDAAGGGRGHWRGAGFCESVAVAPGGGGRAEKLRTDARTWFDAAVWSLVGREEQTARAGAVEAIQNMASSVNEAAQEQTNNARVLQESTGVIQQAAESLRKTMDGFESELEGMPQQLAGITAAAQAAT